MKTKQINRSRELKLVHRTEQTMEYRQWKSALDWSPAEREREVRVNDGLLMSALRKFATWATCYET